MDLVPLLVTVVVVVFVIEKADSFIRPLAFVSGLWLAANASLVKPARVKGELSRRRGYSTR